MFESISVQLRVIWTSRFENYSIFTCSLLLHFIWGYSHILLPLLLVLFVECHLNLHVENLQIVYLTTFPPYLIFPYFLYQVYALKHIGNVVDPALLNIELSSSLV